MRQYVGETVFIIIVGGGRTGHLLATRLLKRNHQVSIIESDPDRAEELAVELDCLVINGTGGDIDVLKDAGGEDADALVSVTGSDEINFMAVKLAKELDIERVVTRVNEDKLAGAFEDLGADAAISFVDAAVTLYERATTSSEMYGLMSLQGGDQEVVEVTVAEDSEVVDESIKDLSIPDLCTVAMVSRGGDLIPPRGDTVFKEKDRVVLVGESSAVMEVAKNIRGK